MSLKRMMRNARRAVNYEIGTPQKEVQHPPLEEKGNAPFREFTTDGKRIEIKTNDGTGK